MEEVIDERSLIQKFRELTNGYAKTHEDDSSVKAVKSLIDKFSKIVKSLDNFLKSKGVDAGALVDRAKDYSMKGAGKALSVKDDIKSKGIAAFAKDQADTVKGKISNMFKTDKEAAAPPPGFELAVKGGEGVARAANPFSIIIGSLERLRERITELTKVNENTLENAVETQKKEEDRERKTSMLERVSQTFSRSKDRASKRAKEIEDEKAGAKGGDKKPKGMFGGIIGALAKGFGSLITFLPNLIGNSLGFVLGKTLKGVFGTLLPKLVPSLARGAQSVTGGLARGAVVGAWGLAKGAVIGAGTAIGGVATAATPFVLPVLAVGAVAYGSYKLYKFLKRNDAGSGLAGKLTRIRLLAYGYNDTIESEYHKVFNLEEMMVDYTIIKDGRVTFRKLDSDFRKKVAEVFEVKAEEKDKFQVLNTWFGSRFLPAYTAFLRSLSTSSPIRKLDEIDKLSDQMNFDLLSKLTFPLEIYDVKSIPYFANTQSPVSKDQVDDLLTLSRKEAQDKIAKNANASPEAINAKKQQEVTKAVSAAKVNNAVLSTNNQIKPADSLTNKSQDVPLVQPPPLAKVPNPDDKNALSATVSSETEVPPKDSRTTTEKPLDSAIGKVNKASGPLTAPTQNLEGIRTDLPKEKIFSLDPNVFALFSGMAKEYKDLTGKDIQLNEAFRTRADQEALFKKYGRGRAAPPGSSLHEHGLAIDVASVDTAELERLGLLRKYGFTRPVGGETWHLEPAGVSLNPREARDNPAVREARVLSSPGRGGGGFGSVPKKPEGGRNIAMQKKLFDQSVGSVVDVNKLKQDQQENLTPVKQSFALPEPVSSPKPAAVNKQQQASMTSQDALNREDAAIVQPQGAASKPMQPPSVSDLNTSKSNSLAPDPTSFKPTDGSYTGNDNLKPNTSKPGSIEEIVRKAAQTVGVNPDTMLSFAKLESGLRAAVGNTTSSAKGLFQIVGKTWRYLVNKYGPKFGVPPDASPSDPLHNSLMGAAYAKENLALLSNSYKQTGISEDVALYLAHHFGPEGAKRILSALVSNPNAPMQAVVSEDAYRANSKELAGKTVAQYVEFIKSKLNKASGTTYPGSSTQGLLDSAQKSRKLTLDDGTDAYTPGAVSSIPDPAKSSATTPSANAVSKGAFDSTLQKQDKPVSQNARRLYLDEETIPTSEPAVDGSGRTKRSLTLDDGTDAYQQPTARQSYNESMYRTGQERMTQFNANPLQGVSRSVNDLLSNAKRPLDSLNSSIGAMGKIPANIAATIGNTIPSALRSLNSPQPTISGGFTIPPTQLPPQPSQALSFDKTNEILTGMSDTLLTIRDLLSSIDKKTAVSQSAPASQQPSPQSQPSEGKPQPPQQQETMSFEKNFMPSKYAVNVSRRPSMSA